MCPDSSKILGPKIKEQSPLMIFNLDHLLKITSFLSFKDSFCNCYAPVSNEELLLELLFSYSEFASSRALKSRFKSVLFTRDGLVIFKAEIVAIGARKESRLIGSLAESGS